MNKINRILAVSTTGIGNMVLYTPVLKTLRKWFPQANITVLCGNSMAAGVIRGSSMTDDIWVLDKSKIKNYIKILMRARKRKFDMVVTSYLDKSFKVGLFTRLTRAPYRLGYDFGIQKSFYNYRAKTGEKEHEVKQNLRLLQEYDKKKEIIRNSEFFLNVADKVFADDYLKTSEPVFGFHPGSGIDTKGMYLKRWNINKFAAVADMLSEKYKSVIMIFGGQGEEELGKKMAKAMKSIPMDLTGKLTLRQTGALIERCLFFVSNDSGLMHIAASLGVPVVAVFGPTLSWKNYPWNTKYRIVKKNMECSPCYQFKVIDCRYARCLEEIASDEVYKVCLELMKETKSETK